MGTTTERPGAQRCVGCPWQVKSPMAQVFECRYHLAFQLIYESLTGRRLPTECMGESCEVWQAFKRLQERGEKTGAG